MKSKEFLKENLAIDAQQMHQDHEVQMAREELYHTASSAIKIHKMLKHVSEEQGIEGWVAEKITLAGDYMHTVADYLEGQAMEQGTHESPAVARVIATEGDVSTGNLNQMYNLALMVKQHVGPEGQQPLMELIKIIKWYQDQGNEQPISETSSASVATVPAVGKGPNVGTLFGGNYKPKTPFNSKKKK